MLTESERLATLYERHHAVRGRYGFTYGDDRRGRLVATWLGRGQRILDVGCRDGTFTRTFAEGNTVVGIDIDRVALARCAQELGITTQWVNLCGDLPFATASFDAANCSEVLEHLPYPDQLVREIARVLVPGGSLTGSVPNAFRLANRLRFLRGQDFEVDPTHLRHFSPQRLRALLQPHFEQVELHFTNSRYLRLSPRLFGNTTCFRAGGSHAEPLESSR